MKILFLGYSKLFRNRLIPVLNNLSEINEIHIAKFKYQMWDDEYKKLVCPKVILYESYEEGLEADVDIAYISSVNSSHFDLAKITVGRNIHTIIDKPAVLGLNQLYLLDHIIGQNQALLAESIVYTYHPQFEKIKELLKYYNSEIRTINILFSIPPIDSDNFRYKKELGGGALNDMGPYAASIGRYFFNEVPKIVAYEIGEKQNGVDISFDTILRYSNNKSVVGHFGFNTEYVNSMIILADNVKIEINRVFTTPDDIDIDIKVKHKDDKVEFFYTVNKANTFYLFFKDVFKAIEDKNYVKFKDIMWLDCKTLELLRHKI
jgi:NDP-hexose-3-ketoreductase